jgi:RNA polymerase sigma factor (sigma-70 family)
MPPPDTSVTKLYKTHAHELRAFVSRRVGRQAAEDIVQETYLHLLQCGTEAPLDHPRAFLFRIASNLAVDALRKTRVREVRIEEGVDMDNLLDQAANPEQSIQCATELKFVWKSMTELPAPWRHAFLLRRLDRLTYPEIACRLNVSIRTAERYVMKASSYVERSREHPPLISTAHAKANDLNDRH